MVNFFKFYSVLFLAVSQFVPVDPQGKFAKICMQQTKLNFKITIHDKIFVGFNGEFYKIIFRAIIGSFSIPVSYPYGLFSKIVFSRRLQSSNFSFKSELELVLMVNIRKFYSVLLRFHNLSRWTRRTNLPKFVCSRRIHSSNFSYKSELSLKPFKAI